MGNSFLDYDNVRLNAIFEIYVILRLEEWKTIFNILLANPDEIFRQVHSHSFVNIPVWVTPSVRTRKALVF